LSYIKDLLFLIFVKNIAMEFNGHIELPEGDFTPGIYNYCNRWYEHCIYTDKGRVFASEKIFAREVEAQKRCEKSMEENKDFWDQVNKTIEEAAELIDSSIGAWSYLRGKLTSEWETIKPMIRMLLWLKMEVEKEFPNAKNFVWPLQPEDE